MHTFTFLFSGAKLAAADAGQIPNYVGWHHYKKYPLNILKYAKFIFVESTFC